MYIGFRRNRVLARHISKLKDYSCLYRSLIPVLYFWILEVGRYWRFLMTINERSKHSNISLSNAAIHRFPRVRVPSLCIFRGYLVAFFSSRRSHVTSAKNRRISQRVALSYIINIHRVTLRGQIAGLVHYYQNGPQHLPLILLVSSPMQQTLRRFQDL